MLYGALLQWIFLFQTSYAAMMKNIDEAKGSQRNLLAFQDFVNTYNRSYEDEKERYLRQRIFEENFAKIERLNKEHEKSKWNLKFAINEFADMTSAEFKKSHLMDNSDIATSIQSIDMVHSEEWATMDSLFDLTTVSSIQADKNWYPSATTGIRDQGQCGSCWAFSAVEQIESDWFLSGKSGWTEPQELSVQQMIDCDTSGAYGCAGTYADGKVGFLYAIKNGGLASEKSYPYVSGKSGKGEQCKKNVAIEGGVIKNYSYVIKQCDLPWDDCNDQDESKLVEYVGSKGPLAICVNAGQWQFYKSGVMNGAACGKHDFSSLDHCVQLTGYSGYESDSAYWIVRNSWVYSDGKPWGENGFIYLAMGNNTCGLANVPTRAII